MNAMAATPPSAEETARAAALMMKSRTQLILNHAFYGALAMRLKLKSAPELTKTAATDGRSLYFNPSFIGTLTLAQTMGLIAHEIGHCIMEHHKRRNGRDPVQWNIAGDLAINPLIEYDDSGIELPAGALMNPAYKGMTTEDIYNRIKIKRPPPPPPPPGAPKGN